MVSVRQTHLQDDTNNVEQWLEQFCSDAQEHAQLLSLFQLIETLGKRHSPLQTQLLRHKGIELIEILAPMNMDFETLMAAILFTLVDSDWLSLEQIEEDYGASLKLLVSSAISMNAIGSLSIINNKLDGNQIEKIRHMLLAMVEDVRAVVIKLAERVVVLREIKNHDEETRVLVAREISQVYAPLANRLGIGQLKWELEDLAFRYLHPTTYMQIAKMLTDKRLDREKYIEDFVALLQQALNENKVQAQVYGRPKHIFSIWKKMEKKNLSFDQLFDVRAVRVVADKLQDCYAALGVVHTQFKHIPSEFDDYVANPKQNGYQSIHTVVVGPEGKSVEIQIRTEAMHQDAELGVAAHWKYKEGAAGSKGSGYEEKINWLRKILQWQEDVAESGNLVEEIKNQVFEDRVYVFTPNGAVIDMPLGSTVLDFAYYIHSQVGHKAIGAKVNGRIVPFTYKVETAQRVEILTQKEPEPKRDWLNANLGYIYSQRARAKIQTWFKKQDKDKNLAAGKEILDNELKHFDFTLKDAELAVARFNMATMDDLLVAIGAGDVGIHQVINHLQAKLNKQPESDEEVLQDVLSRTHKTRKSKGDQVEVEGVGNLMTQMAKCCHPVAGDSIQGFITVGKGISVHRADCEQLKALLNNNPERYVDVAWSSAYNGVFQTKAKVIAQDRSGLLKDVTTILANEKVNVIGMGTRTDAKTQLATIDFEFELNDIDSFSRLLHKIEQVSGVIEAKRC
ncbi:GTP diphosphokinase [Paraferrimonas sp. SM1919]|uniref:GTP diphosphokinase n=1 Tax=Paraferrimonas sp. SM1919 TaxID=2662263 RepID=UPI0013D40141|nr:GTP diphosphokinase [Paraferrimonas sp. SM1919]